MECKRLLFDTLPIKWRLPFCLLKLGGFCDCFGPQNYREVRRDEVLGSSFKRLAAFTSFIMENLHLEPDVKLSKSQSPMERPTWRGARA
jgi:hypothetical protein